MIHNITNTDIPFSNENLIEIINKIFKSSILEKIDETENPEIFVQTIRTILNLIPSPVFILDKNRKVISWNKKMIELTGYTEEETVGKSCFFCLDQDGKNCPMNWTTFKRPLDNVEYIIKLKNGDEKIVTNNVSILYNDENELIGGIESFYDITDKKLIENALYQQASLNSTIAEILKAVITINSIEEFSSMLLEKSMILTSSDQAALFYLSNDNEGYRIYAKNIENNVLTNITISNEHKKFLDNFLTPILQERLPIIENNPLTLNFSDIGLEHHKINRLISGVARSDNDLNAIIIVSNKDKDYNNDDLLIVDRLASIINIALRKFQSEDDMKQALIKESELNQMKTQFILTVSHEYRTPLQSIQLSTDILQKYWSKLDDNLRNKYLDQVSNSIKVMNVLLDDILSFSKVDKMEMQLSPFEVDFDKFIESIIYEVELTTNNKCPIISKFENTSAKIYLDEKVTRNIFIKLLQNSVKYSKTNSEVLLNIKIEGNKLIADVIDSGIGIPKKEQGRIFEPFYRASNVGAVSGSGLGLSFVHRFIQMHNGKINIESELGIGTKITIELPFIFPVQQKSG